MRIFLKHLYRDFRAAPIYPLLVLLTLLFAVAVTVTASALQGMFETHAEQVAQRETELCDLSVTQRGDSPVRMLFAEDARAVLRDGDRVLGEFTLSGTAELDGVRQYLSVSAVLLPEADAFYDFTFIEYGRFTEGNLDTAVVLSESFARRAGLSVGDSFRFELLNTPVTYTVEAVAKDTGLLCERDMLVSLPGVLHLLAARAPAIAALGDGFLPYSRLLLRCEDTAAAHDALSSSAELSDAYIRIAGSDTEGDFLFHIQSTALLLVTLLLLIVTAILTVTALRLLSMRRRTEYALFAAAGASRRQTALLRYAEGGVYALLAAVLGILLAVLLTRGVGSIFPWRTAPLYPSLADSALGLLFAFLFTAICVSVPIFTERARPLALCFEDSERAEHRHARTALILAAVLLLLTLVNVILCLRLPPDERMLPAIFGAVLCSLLLFFGVPHALRFFALLLLRPRWVRMPAALRLSLLHLRELFSLRHAGRLLSVLLAVGFALLAARGALYDRVYVIDHTFTAERFLLYGDEAAKDALRESDALLCGGELGYYSGVEIEGSGYTVHAVSATPSAKACFDPSLSPKRLPQGNEAVLPFAIAELYGISVGDAFTLTYRGNDYRVILSETLPKDAPLIFFDAAHFGLPLDYFAFSLASGEAGEELLAELSARGMQTVTAEAVMGDVGETHASFATLLDCVLAAAATLTLVGIANALLSLYRSRRHGLSLLRTLGTPRGTLCRTLALELALTLGLSLFLSLLGGGVLCFFLDMGFSSFGIRL